MNQSESRLQSRTLELLQAPATLPVTPQALVDFGRTAGEEPTGNLTLFLEAAVDEFERITSRSLISQKWRMWAHGLDYCRDYIRLLRLPVISVEAFKYFTTADTEVDYPTSGNWTLMAGDIGEIMLKEGATWPTDLRNRHAIKIDFTAGYANAGVIPQRCKLAVLQLAMHFYEHREVLKESADFRDMISKEMEFGLRQHFALSTGGHLEF